MRMKEDRLIIQIVGHEPSAEGHFPLYYKVGVGCAGGVVTGIEPRTDHFGDHALGWFDVLCGKNVVASVAERAVAEVIYASPD